MPSGWTKPLVNGPHFAVVVGKDGTTTNPNEIFADSLGRVRQTISPRAEQKNEIQSLLPGVPRPGGKGLNFCGNHHVVIIGP